MINDKTHSVYYPGVGSSGPVLARNGVPTIEVRETVVSYKLLNFYRAILLMVVLLSSLKRGLLGEQWLRIIHESNN